MINWPDEIERIFGDYLSDDRSKDWNNVKEQLKLNESVDGKVVAKAPFGVWVDIGVKFPALIEIIVLNEIDYDEYLKAGVFESGSKIEAKVSGIRDHKRQIYLHQKDWPFNINERI